MKFHTLADHFPDSTGERPSPVTAHPRPCLAPEDRVDLVAAALEAQLARPPDTKELAALRAKCRFFNLGLQGRAVRRLEPNQQLLIKLLRLIARAARLLQRKPTMGTAQVLAYGLNAVQRVLGAVGIRVPDELRDLGKVLRSVCARQNFLVQRFLRRGDAADPAEVDEWSKRLDAPVEKAPCEVAAIVQNAVSPEIAQARNLLAGLGILLIGGVRDPKVEDRIGTALQCQVRQFELGHHESREKMEQAVRDPTVAIVVVAIRITSHATLPAVRTFCAKHGKAAVILPGGWSAAQVARAILKQASDRLMAVDNHAA